MAVIVALMIGGALHGIPDAILAVPTTAILKVVVEELTHRSASVATGDSGKT